MSELEVEQCVKMLELAQVVDHEKLDAWHKVFAKHKLSFEVVSMAMTHLTLVLPKYRKECFELFGFSPDVGTFSDWVVRGRFDFSLARTQSWLHNGQLDYAYEGGDFLVMVDGVVPEKQCCDIWRYYHSKALLGPASATALKLPDCEQRESEVQKVGESVHVSEMPKLEDPVDESENQVLERGSVRTVTEPEKLFPGDMHDMLHLESIEQDNAGITHSGTKYKDVEAVDAQVELGDAVAEASYVSAFLLLYQEEYRAKVHETCGFAPTLLSLVSAEFPMVSMDRLKGFRLVADGDTFEVGRNNSRFRGSACDVLNVLSYVCTVNTGVKDIRLKFDGVDYSGLQSGESLDWLESKYIRLVFEEPVLTVLRANGKSEEHMALGLVDNDWLDAVEPSLRVGLQHAMEFQPGFESFLRMVGARFVEYGLESGLQSTGSVNTCRNVVYVRYRGAGADSVLDAVWTGVETDGVSGPNYPWFRRVVFGNGLPDGKHQLLQTRWVSAVDVPLGVRRGYPLDGRGCSFLRMAFSHDVSHEVNPQLSELWDRVVAHGHGVVEKVDYLGKLVIPKDSLVLVSSERIVKLMRGMLRDMGVAGCCTVSTVAGASGLTAENVVVVDFGEEMFRDDVAACMVAVTRHTVKLQYVGVTLLGGLIREFVERNSCL